MSLLGTVGFPDPHVVSTDTRVGGDGLIPTGQWLVTSPVLRGMEEERCLSDRVGIPGSHMISTDIDDAALPAVRCEGPYLVFSVRQSFVRVQVSFPHSIFAGIGGHSFLCGIWLKQSSYCLKVCCLARLFLSCSFDKREQLLLRLLWPVTIGISRLMTASATGLVYMRQKGNPEILPSPCFLGSEVPGWPTFFSHYNVFFCWFYI